MENTFLQKITTTLNQNKERHFSKHIGSQVYSEIIKSNEKWTDDIFPPSDESLFNGKTDFSNSQRVALPQFLKDSDKGNFINQNSISNKSKKYIWKRLSDVFSSGEINILAEPLEIKDNPDILTEDVIQGDLGDCYFLSAISALAEDPKRIKLLFPKLEFSPSGLFVVKCYIHGLPTEIVVDDFFPFIEISSKEKPIVAFVGINPNTKNIWPMIIEKVWAKVNQSYEDIIAGNPSEAFEFLSPAPVETYYHDVHEQSLFAKIKDADEKKYILCTDISITQNTNTLFLTKMGLVTNHAYAIIDVAEISEPTGKKIKLIKIRNPWGSNEWTGDWSDKSEKWTPEIKKLLNFNDEDDGTFWMAYEDFCKFYTSTHVCMTHTDYHFVSQKFSFLRDFAFNLVRVEIPEDSSGFFIVNQKNVRIYKNAKGLEDFENKYCSVLVFKQDNDNFTYVGASCGRQNRLYVECKDMKKGTYYFAVSFPVTTDTPLDDYQKFQTQVTIDDESVTYRIGVYSPFSKLNLIGLIGKEEKDKFFDFLKHITYDLAKKNENIYYFKEEGEKTSWRSISFEKENGSYGYIVYENNSDASIYEHLTFTQFKNLNLIPVMGNGELETLNLTEEDGIEDHNDRNTKNYLKTKVDFESSVSIIKHVAQGEEVSATNPIELIIRISPKSKCLILIEKFEEDAMIDLTSKIAISYPTHALLDNPKFPTKKIRIKYNDNFVEIYECVIEHTNGVLFIYKNKTSELKFTTHVTFPELVNLKLNQPDEKLSFNDKNDKSVSVDPSNINYTIEDPEKEIVLSLEPGQTKYFELSSQDLFKSFSYTSNFNYHINLAKSKVKQNYGMN